MITFEEHDTKLEIDVSPFSGDCTYRVSGVAVSREDYLAILSSIRTSKLADIAFLLGGDADLGISAEVQKLSEEFDSANDDSFAAKVLKVLEAINLSMP